MKNRSKLTICFAMIAVLLFAGCGRKADPEVSDVPEEPKDSEETSGDDGENENETELVIPAEDPGASVYLIIPSEEGQSLIESEEISRKVKEADIPMIIKCYNRDVEKQTEAFEAAIKDNASLIICDNGDVENTTLEVEKAKAANIPVILLNRGIDSMGIAVSQIITDTYSCVTELGKEFIEITDGQANYIEVQGSNSSFDITEAFADVMSENEEMFMTRSDIADENDPDASYDVIWDMINESPDADSVVCYNVMQTKAAISAAADLGRDLIFVCLYGDDDEITQLVNSGKVFASVIKPGEKLAENAASQVETYINTGELPNAELTYVKGNILKYRDAQVRKRREKESESESESESSTESDSSESEESPDYDPDEYIEVDEYEPAGEGLPE